MIKLPSVQSLVSQLLATIKRFPLAVFCALVGTAMLIHLTRHDWYGYYNNSNSMLVWAKIAMCSELGLCMFIATALFSEAKGYSIIYRLLINLAAFGLVIAYYFSIRHNEHFEVEGFTRFSLYSIAVHLLVAFAPFTGKGQINGFWQFNRTLYLRFLMSFLYTIVLYGGICIAMALLDGLLHVTIHSHYYAYAWFCMIGIFNTVFFLAGVPRNIKELDADTSYLKGLKAFTQFVLLPLVTMYLLILYMYILRILLIGSLPKGYVAYLVISFSGMGIFSLLLIYPIRDLDDNKWIKLFSKWFYWALYPLIILLAFSIYHRVSEYGITTDRYFIVVLAIWLACIAAYFLFSRKENIKIIPVSLCIIAVFSSFGPWGAFSVSAGSQMHQLEKLLVSNKVLVNGKINSNAAANVQDSVRRRAESIVEYLVKTDEVGKIQPWVKQNLDSLHDSNAYSRYSYSYAESQAIMGFMGFSGYDNTYVAYDNNSYKHLTFNREVKSGLAGNTTDIKGFDYFSQFTNYYPSTRYSNGDTTNSDNYFIAGADTFKLVPYKAQAKFGIVIESKTVAVLDLQEFLKPLQTKYNLYDNGYMQIPENELTMYLQADKYEFKVILISVTAAVKDGKYNITELGADILTKVKE
ncbi:MAG: DUF4153 domain-containing protein [Bacteroidia bacterium]